jgi:hypothetical protein
VLADEDLRLPRPPEPSAQPLARAGAVTAGRRLATTLCPSLACLRLCGVPYRRLHTHAGHPIVFGVRAPRQGCRRTTLVACCVLRFPASDGLSHAHRRPRPGYARGRCILFAVRHGRACSVRSSARN